MPNIKDAITITSSMSTSVSLTLRGLPVVVGEISINAKETLKKLTNLKLLKTEHGERYMTGSTIKTISRYGQTACGSNYGDPTD